MSIVEAVRQKRLRSLKASHRSSDVKDSHMKLNAEYARKVLRKEIDSSASEITLYDLYWKMKHDYDGKFHHHKPLTKQGLVFWGRVLKRQQESEVSAQKFMAAQFQYFDKNFGCAPTNQQLITEGAVARAREFAGNEGRKVVASSKDAKINFAELMRSAEKQLQMICKAQNMSRFEVYCNFVIPGDVILPKDYLKNDPEFVRAQEHMRNK